MPALSVFGAQWGDEGKGKIIDRMAREADVVVRYQGGANAGHTVVVGGEKYVLHLIPSGILHPGKLNVIGNGVAVDPLKFLEEIEGLRARGVQVGGANLRLSASAHVIFEHHRRIDQAAERWRGVGRIGTTGRGIGPCYADKAARTGLRVSDLLEPERCRSRLGAALAEKNALITAVHGEAPLDLESQLERYTTLAERLRPFVGDAAAQVRKAWRAGQVVLFEGAQGAMLDIDHGTYPFVTSSNTGVDGIPAGAGFPARWIARAIGIAKAYCTRVGEGPFPSEELGPLGARIREQGHEYGATTGRPRRCGWLDVPQLRYALELNGADSWIMTNLDVLSGFERIRVGVGYRTGSQRWSEYPAELATIEGLEVQYEERTGWREDLTGVRRFEDLPAAARAYVEWVEAQVGVPIVMLSVGPERDQIIPRAGSPLRGAVSQPATPSTQQGTQQGTPGAHGLGARS
jgi:adenylosuccinate synthase